jgi:ZIP family zinc transporter
VQKALLGFASGVMVAASVWSLLIPAMEMGTAGDGWQSVIPAGHRFPAGP